ncbi:hypothetical protein F5Y12DRAFT_796119 [Xylaria sp. FL1777]|nr:hypothetical protein F5Y12DRAFT_796119 [Xylaria sp. FL1777]
METDVSVASRDENTPALITTALVVVSVIFPLLSFLCIALRYKARYTAGAPLLGDDWWVLVSWAFALFLSFDVWIVGSMTGVDHNKIDIEDALRISFIALSVSGVVAQVSLTTVKIGVLLFYKRIFPTRKFQIAVWIGIAVVSAWGITLVFLNIFKGNTVEGTFTGTAKWVIDISQLNLAQAWTSILLILAILCYPLPVLFRLRMKKSRKVAIILILWLGLICSVAAAVRVALLKENDGKGSRSVDSQIHSQYFDIIFVIIEPNLSIIAACLPCYAPLFHGTARHLDYIFQTVRSFFTISHTRSPSRMLPGQTRDPSEHITRGSEPLVDLNDNESLRDHYHKEDDATQRTSSFSSIDNGSTSQ